MILNTMENAFETAEAIIEDFKAGTNSSGLIPGAHVCVCKLEWPYSSGEGAER